MPTFTQGLRFKFWNRKILINGLYQVNFNEIEKYVAATSQKKLLSVFAIPFYFRGALHIRAWRTKNYVEKNGQFCRFFFENKHDKMSVFFWTDIVNIYVKSLLNKSRKGNLNSIYSEECYFQHVTFLNVIVCVNKFCLTYDFSFFFRYELVAYQE